MTPGPLNGLPSDLTLGVGESATVTVPGLSTAGYRWSAEAETDAEDVVELRWRRGPAAGDAPPGVSASESLTITGLRPGSVRVRLVQARAWETGTAPRVVHDVQVRVEA